MIIIVYMNFFLLIDKREKKKFNFSIRQKNTDFFQCKRDHDHYFGDDDGDDHDDDDHQSF